MNADRQTTRLWRGGKRKQEEIRLLFQQLNYCLESGGGFFDGNGGSTLKVYRCGSPELAAHNFAHLFLFVPALLVRAAAAPQNGRGRRGGMEWMEVKVIMRLGGGGASMTAVMLLEYQRKLTQQPCQDQEAWSPNCRPIKTLWAVVVTTGHLLRLHPWRVKKTLRQRHQLWSLSKNRLSASETLMLTT